MSESIDFFLPFGLLRNNAMFRKGKMHLATTLDELDIQATDEVGMNTRYRDIMLLSRVIDEIEGIKPVTNEIIEELFEADFLYLQLLYKELNGEMDSRIKTKCPKCHIESSINLSRIYQDMSLYQKTTEVQENDQP